MSRRAWDTKARQTNNANPIRSGKDTFSLKQYATFTTNSAPDYVQVARLRRDIRPSVVTEKLQCHIVGIYNCLALNKGSTKRQ